MGAYFLRVPIYVVDIYMDTPPAASAQFMLAYNIYLFMTTWPTHVVTLSGPPRVAE